MNLYLLLTLLFFVLSLAGLWGIFEKSGYNGWMSIGMDEHCSVLQSLYLAKDH